MVYFGMDGTELRSALERQGMTQSQFAALLTKHAPAGEVVTPVTVNRWIMEKRKVPAPVALAISLMDRIISIRDGLA